MNFSKRMALVVNAPYFTDARTPSARTLERLRLQGELGGANSLGGLSEDVRVIVRAAEETLPDPDAKETPTDRLLATIELVEQLPRDENGFLTEESRQAVQEAYGSAKDARAEKFPVRPSPFRDRK